MRKAIVCEKDFSGSKEIIAERGSEQNKKIYIEPNGEISSIKKAIPAG
ncbi:MAG: hypothetical protein ABI707_06690 [Ferruginibacter sp.]